MRYSFQNNINAKLGETSRLSLRLNVMLVDKSSPSSSTSSLYNHVINTNPVVAPVYFPTDGETTYVKWGATGASNPVAELVKGYSDLFQSTVTASFTFDQDLKPLSKVFPLPHRIAQPRIIPLHWKTIRAMKTELMISR